MENKYPYIGQSDVTGNVVLLTSQGCGYFIECDRRERVGRLSGKIHETYFKNITSDYLRNTKIRIESPEHSEFVQKLVFGAGGKWSLGSRSVMIDQSAEYLLIDDLLALDSFTENHDIYNGEIIREIKLPMPPKEKQLINSTNITVIHKGVSVYESSNPILHLDTDQHFFFDLDSCTLRTNAKFIGSDDEWPKVGDEVSLRYRYANQGIHITGVVDFISDQHIIVSNCYKPRCDYVIEKPGAGERLERDLSECLEIIDNKDLITKIAKVILVGEIEGLEYRKPQ